MMRSQEASGETVAPVDAAWLRMDRETNPMVIAALLVLDGRVGLSEFVTLLRERLLPHARFRQRVAQGAFGVFPRWEEDPLFDILSHVHVLGLPPSGGDAALGALVSDLLGAPLDPNRPLWQAYLIEGHPTGTALLVRIHHAVADGVALVRVLLDLTGEGRAAGAPEVGRPPAHDDGVLGWVRARALETWTLGRLLALSEDPQSVLRPTLGVRKLAAWSRPVPLAPMRAFAHRHGAKLHDVLAAGVAGALRETILEAGSSLPAVVRAVVPFYLVPEGAPDAGNHFGLVFLPLPVGMADATARVHSVRDAMNRVKTSREAEVALAVLGALGGTHAEVERAVIELFSRKATLMMTNVPGPPGAIHILDHAVRDLVVWAPSSGSLGLGVSFVSYDGSVRLGVAVDAHLAVAPAAVVAAFQRLAAAIS